MVKNNEGDKTMKYETIQCVMKYYIYIYKGTKFPYISIKFWSYHTLIEKKNHSYILSRINGSK